MKVKIIDYEKGTNENYEKRINDFIDDKKVIDIKVSMEPYRTVLILYEDL